jgi:hypothetical protein
LHRCRECIVKLCRNTRAPFIAQRSRACPLPPARIRQRQRCDETRAARTPLRMPRQVIQPFAAALRAYHHGNSAITSTGINSPAGPYAIHAGVTA